MASYDALVMVMDLLQDIIIHHHRYPTLLSGTLELMKSLHEKFCLLEESWKDHSSNYRETVDHVEDLIRNAAFQAHDIIEFEILDQIEPKRVFPRKFHWLTGSQNTSLMKMGQKIDSVMENLVEIKERQRNKNLQHNNDSATAAAAAAVAATGATEQVHALSGRNMMVGFDEYLTKIKDQLSGYSSHLQVISIVGTGGIGKTTLARHTFDDPLVMHRFDIRSWAAVSQDYSINNVLQSLLTSMGLDVGELHGKQESGLEEKLYKFLKGKRYFIVIDDVWSVQVWDDLRRVFPDDRQGSRIMLTTRLMDVAQCLGTSCFIHELQFLDAKDCWSLFQKKLFGQNCCPPGLENIGRSIVSKCHGLPLAIVVIGGLLSNAKRQHDWEEISENMSTTLILWDIFSLSYDHLSHQQKACFLYMGSYPEDYQINFSNLIMLWIAEGFLKSTDESKSLEEMGEECLEGLVKRSLVLVTKKGDTGKFKLCVLHDLLRDFCKSEAFHHNFYQGNECSYPRSLENVRRFHAYLGGQLLRGYPLDHSKCLRSLIMFGQHNAALLNQMKWNEHKLLRVLGYHDALFSDPIPNEIYEMIHMKYLRWNVWARTFNNETLHIPPSISALQNLQSLIIDNLWKCIVYLPPEIWMLTKLRHVIIHGMKLPPIPMVSDSRVMKLKYLKTLMTVHGFRFTREAIEMIPNLAKLKAYCSDTELNSDCDRHDLLQVYGLNNLVHLQKLEELKISFYFNLCQANSPHGFSFPINLTKLSLTGNGVLGDCMIASGSLLNLQVLKLESIRGDRWDPKEGEFCNLKVLKMKDVDYLWYWQEESCQFPRLEFLFIRNCDSLEIPLEVGDIPTLKLIEVFQSAKAQESAVKIQEEQESLGNDALQVRVVSC